MNKKDIMTYKILENYDELIVDNNYRYHLYRNCEELNKGLEAIFATSYHNNWWKYRDINGFEHLFNSENVEVTKNIKTMVCHSYNNGYWKYMSKNGSWNILNKEGTNITIDIPYLKECFVYDNGDYEYTSENDEVIFVKNKI